MKHDTGNYEGMKFGETAKRLRQAMDDIKINQKELSRRSGVSKSSISQYYNGSHSPSNISAGKLADVLMVSPVWLMGFEVDKARPVGISTFINTKIKQLKNEMNIPREVVFELPEKEVTEIAELDADILADERTISLARKFFRLSDDEKSAIENMINILYEKRTED